MAQSMLPPFHWPNSTMLLLLLVVVMGLGTLTSLVATFRGERRPAGIEDTDDVDKSGETRLHSRFTEVWVMKRDQRS